MNIFLIVLLIYLLIVLANFLVIKLIIKHEDEVEKDELVTLTVLMLIPIVNIGLLYATISVYFDIRKDREQTNSFFLKHLYGLKEEKRDGKIIYTYKGKTKEK